MKEAKEKASDDRRMLTERETGRERAGESECGERRGGGVCVVGCSTARAIQRTPRVTKRARSFVGPKRGSFPFSTSPRLSSCPL